MQAELGVRAGWEHTQELLAVLVEDVRQLTVLTHHAWFKPPHPSPQPIPRPWDPTTDPAASSNGEEVARPMPSELLDLALAGIAT